MPNTEHKTLIEALVAAQADMRHAYKNKSSAMFGSGGYAYADLPSVLDAVVPALNRHGIALVQPVSGDGASITVKTILCFKGETLEGGSLTMPISAGSRGNVNHAAASAVTYARRVTIQAMCGISSDEDDDGNSSMPNGQPGQQPRSPAPPPEPPGDKLRGILANHIGAKTKEDAEACIRYATAGAFGVADIDAHAPDLLGVFRECYDEAGASWSGFLTTARNYAAERGAA